MIQCYDKCYKHLLYTIEGERERERESKKERERMEKENVVKYSKYKQYIYI